MPDTISSDALATITLSVNGVTHRISIEPRVSLLDVLREVLGLTGTKKGCNQGACGACTVLADGERINSCLALALQYEDCEITTIEGLMRDGVLHPLQAAFIKHDGLQCGYCTPGQICSAVAMAQEFRRGMPSAVSGEGDRRFSDAEIKERMSGNLCRCGAYRGIVDSIHEAFDQDCGEAHSR
jgi:xanthine dehydrogenase YagT iron-sulfur-binding subunit